MQKDPHLTAKPVCVLFLQVLTFVSLFFCARSPPAIYRTFFPSSNKSQETGKYYLT